MIHQYKVRNGDAGEVFGVRVYYWVEDGQRTKR